MVLREACRIALLKSRLGSLARAAGGGISGEGADSEMGAMVEEGERFFLLWMT